MHEKFNGNEIIIKYPKMQKELYRKEDPTSIIPMFPTRIGIHKVDGNFAAMVVRKHFEDQGYSLLSRYLLVRCCRQREANRVFQFLIKTFGRNKVDKVIADAKKLNLRGGAHDLFVYKKKSETFFAEAKDTDKVTKNQLALFPIIERYLCPVIVARIEAQ